MRFELTRAEHNGLAVHRLNHSATSSTFLSCFVNFTTPIVLKTFNSKRTHVSTQDRTEDLQRVRPT